MKTTFQKVKPKTVLYTDYSTSNLLGNLKWKSLVPNGLQRFFLLSGHKTHKSQKKKYILGNAIALIKAL